GGLPPLPNAPGGCAGLLGGRRVLSPGGDRRVLLGGRGRRASTPASAWGGWPGPESRRRVGTPRRSDRGGRLRIVLRVGLPVRPLGHGLGVEVEGAQAVHDPPRQLPCFFK